jgi:hypothetical protein
MPAPLHFAQRRLARQHLFFSTLLTSSRRSQGFAAKMKNAKGFPSAFSNWLN